VVKQELIESMSIASGSVSAHRGLIYLIVAVITLACLLMNGPMRGGLPVGSMVAERMSFIANHTTLWQLSWLVWMVSALGLLSFCLILYRYIAPCSLSLFGIVFVALGIVPDLSAEVIYAFLLPTVAALSEASAAAQFVVFEQLAIHLTGFLGNGLYNLGGLLLTTAAIRQRLMPSWVAVWGVASWLLGLGLSVSIAAARFDFAEFFTATSMVLNVTWMLVVARVVVK